MIHWQPLAAAALAGWASYVISSGQFAAVVANPFVVQDAGYNADPRYGYPHGWAPDWVYHGLPYDRDVIGRMEDLDPAQMDL